jgi:HAD superfamily phosphoserine phosphatase-like hydrolase
VFKDLLQGFSVRELSFHVAAFVEKELDSLLYLPAIERLKKAQHLGHFTAILSSSPSFLVRAIAERLQVDEWKSSEYKVDKDDCLCQISSILHGEDKAFWVRKMQEKFHMSIESVTAYSDSYLDLPFLRSAGTAIVVNPDSKLKRVSLKCNWEEI